jgi:hypothetical protein
MRAEYGGLQPCVTREIFFALRRFIRADFGGGPA